MRARAHTRTDRQAEGRRPAVSARVGVRARAWDGSEGGGAEALREGLGRLARDYRCVAGAGVIAAVGGGLGRGVGADALGGGVVLHGGRGGRGAAWAGSVAAAAAAGGAAP